MKLPSILEVLRMFYDMEVLDHIVAHSIQVRNVALVLTERLRFKGVALDARLVETSALLHDITKTRSLKTKENHARTGFEFLSRLGFSEVGYVVRQHVVLDDYDASRPIQEADIVNYSDKRVLHDKVVPLSKRKDYILEKYGTQPEQRQRILQLWEKTQGLEERLFKDLPFAPEALEFYIEDANPYSKLMKLFQKPI